MLVAMIAYIFHVANHENVWFGRLGTLGLYVAIGTDMTAMLARYMRSGHVPWSNLFEAIMYCTLITLIMYMVVERYYGKKLLGIGASAIGIMMFGYATLILPKEFDGPAPLMPALQSYWIKIHTTIIVGSYAPFMLAAATAVAYLVVTRGQDLPQTAISHLAVSDTVDDEELRQLNLAFPGSGRVEFAADGPTGELKPQPQTGSGSLAAAAAKPDFNVELAELLDDITYRLISLGFPMLAIGIMTGGLWAWYAWGAYWSWDPKENWALATLLIYAIYLHGRLNRGWLERKSAIMAIVGFIFVGITFIGFNYLAGGLHSYGFQK